jgi:phospholipid-binding lipoprotein MlaA
MVSQYFKLVVVALVSVFFVSAGTASPVSNEIDFEKDALPTESSADMGLEDPFECINRGLFAINDFLDGLIFRPAACAYVDLLAVPVQDAISNFFDNLASPVTLANDILQAEGRKAGETFTRLIINTTIGIGGLFDVAAEWCDIQPHKSDFGMTLRSYDISAGPYLFIPLVGPSTFVDAIGRVVDYFIDPFNLYMIKHDHDWITFARAGAQGVITRAKVLPITDSIEKTADPYAQYRIYYLQNRDSMVKGEKKTKTESPIPPDVIKDK